LVSSLSRKPLSLPKSPLSRKSSLLEVYQIPAQSHYFQLPWDFPMEPVKYRVDSRLLIANLCESDKAVKIDGHMSDQAQRCGAYYFLMSDNGLTLIYKVLEN
jgi:hypothetical protein